MSIMGALDIPEFMRRDTGKAYGAATGPKLFIGFGFDGERCKRRKR